MMNDWLPIDEVTPENCPDGSTVRIELKVDDNAYLLYKGIIHWDSENHFTLERTPDATPPADGCTK
jgi:hypothetical protein